MYNYFVGAGVYTRKKNMAVVHRLATIGAKSLILLLLTLESAGALRGLGLPHRELFSDALDLHSTSVNSSLSKVVQDSSRSSDSNTTQSSSSGLTVSGLKEELSNLEDKVKEAEQRHRKGHLVAAAIIGSLLLVIAVGCAGMLAYRRFVNSQHANKRSKADRLPYYDEDRLLGDAAGL